MGFGGDQIKKTVERTRVWLDRALAGGGRVQGALCSIARGSAISAEGQSVGEAAAKGPMGANDEFSQRTFAGEENVMM